MSWMKNSFINLLFTHKEFPAAAPHVRFWPLEKTMFPWQNGCTLHSNLAQKKSNLLFWLECNGCTTGMSRSKGGYMFFPPLSLTLYNCPRGHKVELIWIQSQILFIPIFCICLDYMRRTTFCITPCEHNTNFI